MSERQVVDTPEKKYWGRLAYLNYKKPVYNKTTVKSSPHQVAAYTTRKNYKQPLSDISPSADILIDEILNPEDCTEVERWPNTYGLSAVYKCKTILNARFDSTGRSCVSVSPNIKDSIFATYGDESSYSIQNPYATSRSDFHVNPYSFQNVTLDSNVVYWNAPIIFPGGQALLPFPYAPMAELLYPMTFHTTTAPAGLSGFLEFTLPNAITNQGTYGVKFYDATMAVISSRNGSFQVNTNGSVGARVLIGVSPNIDLVKYMSIILYPSPQTKIPYKGQVYIRIVNDDVAQPQSDSFDLVLPNHAQHVAIYDIKDAGQIQTSAVKAFVLAQSLLITAEMSDINNGGMMSIARVPGGTAVGADSVNFSGNMTSNNWYEWLSSLSNNNYDGPVKDGGYSFYLPEDETGFFYRPIDNYFTEQLPYMASEFTVTAGLQETAIVRIKVCTIVQFTTNASIYDQRPSCHLMEIDLVHHILSLVPAAYSNDGHKQGLKKVLKSVGGSVRKMLRDPNTYKNMAKVLGTLAPLLL